MAKTNAFTDTDRVWISALPEFRAAMFADRLFFIHQYYIF